MTNMTLRLFLRRTFGLLYLLWHLIIGATLCVLITHAITQNSPDSGLTLLIYPILGILSGYWIWKNSFSLWRTITIAASLLVNLVLLIAGIWFFPQITKLHKNAGCAYQKNNISLANETLLDAALTHDINRLNSALASGANINTRNEFGQTALHLAISDPEIVRFLIEQGADVNAKDHDFQMTPIFSVDVETAKLLVAAGANINTRSKDQNTPMIWYAYSGYQEGIEYLLSLNADVTAINKDGHAAFEIAEQFRHINLLHLLKPTTP